MNQKFLKVAISTAMISLAACNKDSDNIKGAAAVPVAPERIYAVTSNGFSTVQDQNNYCDITATSPNQKSLVCYSSQGNGSAACAGPAINFESKDQAMCAAIQQAMFSQNSMGGFQQQFPQQNIQQQQCGRVALQSLFNQFQQRCSLAGTGTGNQLNPNLPQQPVQPFPPITNIGTQPLDPSFKTIQCEFEALRHVEGRWIQRDYNTGHLTTSVVIDSRMRQEIDLRRKFLGIDIGDFGNTKMTFTPAGLRGAADTITVSNSGLNQTTSTSQSGFAGQDVRLEIQNDEGTLRLMVSCKGQSQFKKNLATKTFTKFNCKGSANLGSRNEKIDISLPYQIQNDVELAKNLTLNMSGDTANQDNARVSITAFNDTEGLTIQTSAYLKTSAQMKMSDGYSNVEVICSPAQ